MKIAILHHHFNRGGVTQVVQSHLHALSSSTPSSPLEIVLLHGGRANALPSVKAENRRIPVHAEVVAGLDYASSDPLEVESLSARINQKLGKWNCHPEDTILHVHNHSLGKNPSLPGALRRLAEQGFRQLLHLHDFAEDLRPDNFRGLARALGGANSDQVSDYLYPLAPHIHYGVLNRRDFAMLRQTGIDEQQLHLLPNPVESNLNIPSQLEAMQEFQAHFDQVANKRLILYPVRAIRRKNLGELLLWAASSPPDIAFAVTLPAESDDELGAYQHWKSLARTLKLPINFEVGRHPDLPFETVLGAAAAIITTSVAEGFGLVFLESWLHGRVLIGRDIPEITSDFRKQGLDLSQLSSQLLVPLDWLSAPDVESTLVALQTELSAAYGLPVDVSALTQFKAWLRGESIDFAILPTRFQTDVIRRVTNCTDDRARMLRLNPWMLKSLELATGLPNGRVQANADVVRRSFSLKSTGRHLVEIYNRLIACPTSGPVSSFPNSGPILNSFLAPERLCPIRIEN